MIGLCIQKFGTFKVGLVGSIMLAVGSTGSYLATSLSYIIVSISLLAGMFLVVMFLFFVGRFYRVFLFFLFIDL